MAAIFRRGAALNFGIIGEKNVAITGIGQSRISLGSDRSALDLTLDATLAALADAGLSRADIDGLSTYPGPDENASGQSPIGAADLQDALRLNLSWYTGAKETAGQLGAIFNAIAAISAGYCRNVLIFRTVYEASARKQSRAANAIATPGQRVAGRFSYVAPYFALSTIPHQAQFFSRYVHESGVRPEQVAQIPLNARRNAALNPAAVMRKPMTLDDYLASPMLATPLRLLDCDVPIDGSTALVVSRRDVARDLRNPVIRIEAVGTALRDRNSWVQINELDRQVTQSPADMMWARTDLKPKDVDVAQIYDGFSYHSLVWLESFGFCKRNEAGEFIGDGKRIALDGELPLHTGGGQLSGGRMHAYGHLHEACVQLLGRGGERQVRNAPAVALVSTAGGPLSGCMMLVRE